MPKYGLRLTRPDWRPKDTWKPVIAEILARHPQYSRHQLLHDRRHNSGVSWVRFEIWWTINTLLGASQCDIAKRLGDYNSTSVWYGIKLWQASLDAVPLAA